MNVATTITLARLLAVPLIIYLIVQGSYGWAFVTFALAGASDAVDGTVAKLLNQTTRLGRILDPVADKTLIVSVYVVLGLKGAIAEPVVIVVVLREVLIVIGVAAMALLHEPSRARAAQVSRINTGMQVFFATFVLADLAIRLDMPRLTDAFGYLVIATTLASGGWYLLWLWRRLNRLERAQ